MRPGGRLQKCYLAVVTKFHWLRGTTGDLLEHGDNISGGEYNKILNEPNNY